MKKLLKAILPDKCFRVVFQVLVQVIGFVLKWHQKIKYHFFRRRVLTHLKRTRHLVLEAPPMSVPYTKNQFEELDRKILDKVRLSQFDSCAEDPKFLVVQRLPGGGYGGGLLTPLLRGLRLGYLYNRTVLYDDSNLVHDFCFEPIGSHSLKSTGLETEKLPHFNFLPQKDKAVWFKGGNSMEWAVEAEASLLLKLTLPSGINYTAPLNRLPYNEIYINGLLMDAFLKLKEEYKEHIENRKREMGFETPIIGLHIRQGDVKTNNASPAGTYHRSHPVEDFFETIEKVASETNIKTVFVTSDSEKTLRQLPKDSGLTFIYDKRERRYDNCNIKMITKKLELRKQETMTAVKNIYLLGDCDYIVGIRGNFFRHGIELSYYRNKKLNGILMRRKRGGGYALEYLVTDDDKLTANVPVEPYMLPLHKRGAPWLR